MPWDLLLFFVYCAVLLTIGCAVWYIIPKPEPYDYTTIPGSKPENPELGDLAEIRDYGILRFMDRLHISYGPLASFYWGSVYAVSVSSFRLFQELAAYDSIIAQKGTSCISRAFTALGDVPQQCVPSKDSIEVSYRKLKMDFNDSSSSSYSDTKSFIHALIYKLVAETSGQFDDCTHFMESLLEWQKEIQSRIEAGPEDTAEWSHAITDDHINGHSCSMLDGIFCFASALLKCLTFLQDAIRKDSQLMQMVRSVSYDVDDAGFTDDPTTTPMKGLFLETLRCSLPCSIFYKVYREEIDIDAHPVPAMTPVFFVPGILLGDKDILANPERFGWRRFTSKSSDAGAIPYIALGLNPEDSAVVDRFCDLFVLGTVLLANYIHK